MNQSIKSLKIRPETPADYPDIAQIHVLAFGQNNEAELIAKVRDSKRYIPQLSLIAEMSQEKVGHILLSPIDLIADTTKTVLALAPMAVKPNYQRQGIGTKLVERAIACADQLQYPLIVVLGHTWFYPRLGFEPADLYHIEPPFSLPREVFMVKPLNHYHPDYQGKVHYPAAFDGV